MRDSARDVLRGLTFYEMEYVNHSEYLPHQPPGKDGLRYADTVFPTFLFVAGMSPRSARRNIETVGLGLVYNCLKSANHSWLESKDNVSIRPFGVLQRIGLSGLLLAAAPDPADLKSCAYPIGAIALWIALSFGLSPDRRHPFRKAALSAQTKIDRAVVTFLGPQCATYTSNFDPEGLLGTLMASVSMWFGGWISSNITTYNDAFMTGISFMSLGHMFSYAFPRTCPMNKPYWTLSYLLSTSGISLLKYSLLKVVLPYLPTLIVQVLECTGQHTLGLFFASAILDKTGIPRQIRKMVNRVVGGIAGDFISTSVVNIGLSAVVFALARKAIL